MKLPAIEAADTVTGPAGQQAASVEDFVPGWRQVDTALRQAGGSAQDVFQGGEALAVARQREAISSGEIGEAIGRLTDPIEKRYKQVDFSNQQVRAAQIHLAEVQYANEVIAKGDPGDPNLVEKYVTGFDERYADTISEASTPEGRAYMAHALAEARSSYGVHILTGQKERAGQKAKQNVEDYINAKSELARVNTARAPQVMKDAKEFVANQAAMNNLTSEQGQALGRLVNEKIVVATLDGIAKTAGGPQLIESQLSLPPEDRNTLFKSLAPGMDAGIAAGALREAKQEIRDREREDRAAKMEARQAREEGAKVQASAFLSDMRSPGNLTNLADKLRDPNFLKYDPGMKSHLANVLDAKIKGDNTDHVNHGEVERLIPTLTPNTKYGDLTKYLKPGQPDDIGVTGLQILQGQVDRLRSEQGRNVNSFEAATKAEIKKTLGDAFTYVGLDGKQHTDLTQYNRWLSSHYDRVQENEKNGVDRLQSVMRTWDGKENPNWTGHSAQSFFISPEKKKAWQRFMMSGKVAEAQRILIGADHDETVPAPPPGGINLAPLNEAIKQLGRADALEGSKPGPNEPPPEFLPITGAPVRYAGKKIKQGLDYLDKLAAENEQKELKGK